MVSSDVFLCSHQFLNLIPGIICFGVGRGNLLGKPSRRERLELCFLGVSGHLTLANRDHLGCPPTPLPTFPTEGTYTHIHTQDRCGPPLSPHALRNLTAPVSSFRPLTPALGRGGGWVFTLSRFLWSCFAEAPPTPHPFSQAQGYGVSSAASGGGVYLEMYLPMA